MKTLKILLIYYIFPKRIIKINVRKIPWTRNRHTPIFLFSIKTFRKGRTIKRLVSFEFLLEALLNKDYITIGPLVRGRKV